MQDGFAAEDGDAWLRVALGQVRRKVNLEDFGPKGTANGGGGPRSHHQDPVRVRQFEGELVIITCQRGRRVRAGVRGSFAREMQEDVWRW